MAADARTDLKSVAGFLGLKGVALGGLTACLEPFAAAPGEVLFRANDPAEGMHVIAEGRIAVRGRTLADGLVHLADIGPGEVVGEFGLVDQGRRSATAEAAEPTRGFFMPREQFERLMFARDPGALALFRQIRALACSRTRANLAAIAADTPPPGECRPSPDAPPPRASAGEGATEMLGALHQFRAFKPAELAELVAAAEVLEAGRGAVLTRAGEPAAGLWIVLRGAVRTGLDRRDGVEQLLLHGPGKLVGGCAALDGQPQATRLDVREDARLLHLPQARLDAWRDDPAPMPARLIDLVCKQLIADLRILSRHRGRRRSMAALNREEAGLV